MESFDKLRKSLLTNASTSGKQLIADLGLNVGEQLFVAEVVKNLLPELVKLHDQYHQELQLRPVALPAAVALLLIGAESTAAARVELENALGLPPTGAA